MTFEVAVVGTMGEEEKRRGEERERSITIQPKFTLLHRTSRREENIQISLERGGPLKKNQKPFCLSEGLIVDNLTFILPIKPDLQI